MREEGPGVRASSGRARLRKLDGNGRRLFAVAIRFVPWLAARIRPDRVTASLVETIQRTIPNRIAYFDNQHFDMRPLR